MKGRLIVLLIIMTSCSKIGADSKDSSVNDSLMIDNVKTDTPKTILGETKDQQLTIIGDTITQRLKFEVGGNDFDLEVKYIIKEPYEFTSFWQKEILEFRPIQCPESFSKDMIKRLEENFVSFYYIPVKNFEDKIQPTISAKDISEFFIIKDYNLDGITDFGISDTPTGNNVFEDIYVNLDNNFFHWKGFSGKPIWSANLKKRTITTGWHMSADIHSMSEFKITNDTTLTEIFKEETEEFNDNQIIKKTFKYSVLTKVDTLNRNID